MYFKRILILVLFISFFIIEVSSLVNANDNVELTELVLIVNSPLSNDEINLDGYTIYANNVNYNEIGEYQIIYINDNNEKFTRKIKIIDKETSILEASSIVKVEYKDIYKIEKININGNDNNYYIIASFKRGLTNCFCVIYYEDNYLIWFKDYSNNYIDSFILYANKTYKLNLIMSDILDKTYIVNLTRKGSEEKRELNQLIPLNIKYDKDKDYLYLLYERNIKTINFTDLKEIGEINFNDYINVKKYKLLDYKINTNSFDYYYKIENDVYLFQVNMDLLLLNQKKLELELQNNLILSNYNDNACTYKIDNKSLVLNIIYDINNPIYFNNKLNFEEEIINVNVEFINELLYLSVKLADETNHYYKIYKDLVFDIELESADSMYFNNTTIAYIYDEYTLTKSIDKLEMIINKEKNEHIELERIYFFKEGINLPIIQETPYEKYGSYTLKLEKQIENKLYIIDYDYFVNDECNIKGNENYTSNTPITFIGEAYLNNEPIESGYLITEAGDYSLKLIGNKENKFIYFKVTSINEKYNDYEEISNNLIEVKNIVVNKKEQDESVINITKENSLSINPYLYIVMVFLASFLFIIIIKFNQKRRQK